MIFCEKSLGSISKTRDTLFAFAIIAIVFCHTSMNFGNGLPGQIYYVSKVFGQMGVDIFFFLSGMGLWYSYNKDVSAASFLKKRLVRILPAYVVVALPWFVLSDIIYHHSVSEFLLDFFLLSFWVNGTASEWFVSAILILYIFYPLIYKLSKTKGIFAVTVAVIYLITLLIYSDVPNGSLPHHIYIINELFFVRIPIFMLGTYLAPFIKENRIVSRNQVIFLTILNLAVLFTAVISASRAELIDWYFLRLLFCPLSITFCVLVAPLLESCEWHSRFLSFLGAVTLEIYLINEKSLELLKVLAVQYLNIPIGRELLINLLSVAITVLLAWLVNKIANAIASLLNGKTRNMERTTSK